jgi:transcriptional regulator with XRE-family HTH domain
MVKRDISLFNRLKRRISLKNQKIPVGSVLKRLRKTRKLSQEELGFLSSIDRTFMSKIERDIQEPGLGTIFSIANALNMKAYELIKEIEENLEID